MKLLGSAEVFELVDDSDSSASDCVMDAPEIGAFPFRDAPPEVLPVDIRGMEIDTFRATFSASSDGANEFPVSVTGTEEVEMEPGDFSLVGE
jgi:hypothetical protein